jgi:hypothetical protein
MFIISWFSDKVERCGEKRALDACRQNSFKRLAQPSSNVNEVFGGQSNRPQDGNRF